jgi:tartrate dehydratase alpha subunit/fumarate hydratase class I-like protein
MQAVGQQSWDVSVKGLTQFPDVINQMAIKLSWTSALRDADYNIPRDVMNAVQLMRQRAQQAGILKSNTRQNVALENQAPACAPAATPKTVIVQAK